MQGSPYTFSDKISIKGVPSPAPEQVYQSVRRDHPEWHFKLLPDGLYRVRLHFSDAKSESSRGMSFWFQEVKLIENFSVNNAAGGPFRAAVHEVIVAVANGAGLKIRGSNRAGDDCFVAGIEILAAPKDAQATPAIEDETQRPSDLASRIRKFTGGATRLVWTRLSQPRDVFSLQPNSRLFGFDTEDGSDERCILAKPGSYSRPLLSPDGKLVVFSDVTTHFCYVVNFDGTGLQEFAQGYAPCLWVDPKTCETWVCVREKEGQGPVEIIVRRKLSDAKVAERIWTTSDNGESAMSHFHLMSDGAHAIDSNPWPNVGTIDLARGLFHLQNNGCWPGVAPDDSGRFFIFRGNHRSIVMFDSPTGDGRRVNIDTVPNAPSPTVYHPHWTNHPRFITVTSPDGHPESKIYLGKWSDNYSAIDAWQRVTWSESPDAFGDAWIANSPVITSPLHKLIATKPAGNTSASAAHRPGLVFLWENQRADNAIIDEQGRTTRLCRAALHGNARPSLSHGADIRDGSLDAENEQARALATEIARTGAMTLSFVTQVTDSKAGGIVACYGSPPQIVIEQTGGKLEARFPASAMSTPVQLGEIIPGKPQIWMLVCQASGGQAAHPFDLHTLQPGPLRFGRDAAGNGSWRGTIEQIEIFNRALDAGEIVNRRASLEREWSQRQGVPRITVEAELVQASKTEEPEDIRPYRRSLSENLYRVRKVLSGELKAEKFIALQWSILDGQKQKMARKPGDVVTLNLEAEEAHAELGGEHRSSELIEVDLPLLYDVDS